MNESNKPLPHDLDSEKIVLGTIMNEKGAYDKIAEIVNEDCFYQNNHKRIFKAIKQIVEGGKFPDMILVSQQAGTDLMFEIVTIAGSSSSQMYQHALILKEYYIRRKLISLSWLAGQQAYETSTDIDETINRINEGIKSIYEENTSGTEHISEAVERMRENIKENMMSKQKASGSITGFDDFDKRSGGLQGTDLVIIAGESSMGKTSLALSIVNNTADYGNPVAVYSLEMSSIQLASRFTSMRTGIPSNEILYSKLTQEQFERIETGISRVCNLPIYVDERSTSNIDTILSSIRNMKAKYGIAGAVVDYLQITSLNQKGVSEETKLAEASRRLKNLAKELNIWIVALSQLNRNDGNPYPTLGRLRGSGQIGEAADIVMFAYRPEYYSASKTYTDEFAEYTTRGTALIDVAKGRNIGTFRFLVKFDKQTTHFEQIEDMNEYLAINDETFSQETRPF